MKMMLFSYLLARHAKRVILKVEDIRQLRQIWKIIQPNHLLGEDTLENQAQKELKEAIEKLQLAEQKKRMEKRVAMLRRHNRLRELKKGEITFMRGQKMPVPSQV